MADASCLIALDRLDLVPKLAFLFGRLLIPKAVRGELYRRRRTRDRIKALLKNCGFLHPCDDYDQGAVDVLLTERARVGKKNRGEAEAVVQADSVGAVVLVDDRWGRKLAQRYLLESHGTFWLLERLHDLRLLPPHDLRRHLRTLSQQGFRLPLGAVNRLLERVGEQTL